MSIQLAESQHEVFEYPADYFVPGKVQIQNRRFLGNKFKLLEFIADIVRQKCGAVGVFVDIFSGTGVVGNKFNSPETKIISNDILQSNVIPLKTFLGTTDLDMGLLCEIIESFNMAEAGKDNYFSDHFGGKYFTAQNARKIGMIRQAIEDMDIDASLRFALITSLIYAVDKVANTVGHYDAFRKKIDMTQPLQLLVPDIDTASNINNEVYSEDANALVRKIECDVLYLDPPYNSRQYCDSYHLLENLVRWEKPEVFGITRKMDRNHLKSKYCLISARDTFEDLIMHANCRHILVSYNNTRESKDCRSNSRIKDAEIEAILRNRGSVEVFERDYKAFTTGRSVTDSHTERVFYCHVH